MIEHNFLDRYCGRFKCVWGEEATAAAISAGATLTSAAGTGISAGAAGYRARKNARFMQQQQFKFQREQTEAANLRQDQLIADQRAYSEEMYNKYDSPLAQRRQMLAAGINPMFNGAVQSEPFQGGAPAASPISPLGGEGGSAPMEQTPDYMRAGAAIGDAAFAALGNKKTNHDIELEDKQWDEQKKQIQANVAKIWSSIDVDDAHIANLKQTTANLLQENRENEYNLTYLGAVLNNKIEREALQNNLMRSENDNYQAYGRLLNAQADREEFAKELDKIAKEHNELALDFDKKSFTDRLRQIKADRHISEEDYKLAQQAYQVGLADVARAALDQMQTERKIDIEKLNENLLRDLTVEQYGNMAADIRAHVADMILDRGVKLANTIANGVTSFSAVRGNQIRMYNAQTRRAQWGLTPHRIPNSERSVPVGTYFNPSSSWMHE